MKGTNALIQVLEENNLHVPAGSPAGGQFAKKGAGYGSVSGEGKSTLVGYEWRSTLDEKYSAREEGLVGKKVSDWSRSDTSHPTGREIVHIYLIQGADGEIRPHGKQAAAKVLGLRSDQVDKKADPFIKQAMAEKTRMDNARKDFPKRPVYDSIAASNRAYAQANKHDPNIMAHIQKEVSVYTKGGQFRSIMKGLPEERIAAEQGWKVAWVDGHRV